MSRKDKLSLTAFLVLTLGTAGLCYGVGSGVGGALFLLLVVLTAVAYGVLIRPCLRTPPSAAELPLLLRHQGALWAAALLLRLAPFSATPILSDDVYRYLWEGKVQRAGHSPYRHAPDDALLTPLRDAEWEKVNHKGVSAAYPPLAEVLFRANHFGLPGWKLWVLGADLALLAWLLRILRRDGRPPAEAALYAFHPLVVVEFAGSAHLDALALLPVMMAVTIRRGGHRDRLAGLLTAGAGLLKPQGLVHAANLLVRRRLAALGVLLVALVLGFLPFWQDGANLFRGLQRYGEHWEFNALVYPWVQQGCELAKSGLEGLSSAGSLSRLLRELGYGIAPTQLARKVCLLLFLGLGLLVSHRLRDRPAAGALWVSALFLAFSPTVHPWYGTWLVPLLVFHRSAPLLLLTLTLPFAGWVKVQSLAHGIWQEPGWLGWTVWGPAVLLLLFETRRRRSGVDGFGGGPARHQPGSEPGAESDVEEAGREHR